MIAVDADLRAEIEGIRLRVNGRANVLTCRIDGDAANLFEALRHGRRYLPMVRSVVPFLVRTGVRLDVVIGTVPIGRAGSGVKQNALARLLRLPSVQLGA